VADVAWTDAALEPSDANGNRTGRAGHTRVERKRLGAFYTPEPIARFIASWAIRSKRDTVLDPSFGGLVFLDAAVDRLCELGSTRAHALRQVYGVDIDEPTHAWARAHGWGGLNGRLRVSDFFAVSPEQLPSVNANIGNPPYIRYQRWSDDLGLVADACEQAGVRLDKRASLWAPFLLHSCRFLARGGCLGQVLPGEVLFAQYAKPVVEHLQALFSELLLVVFKQRVFSAAETEVVLLLADGYGEGPAQRVQLVECEDAAALGALSSRPRNPYSADTPLLGLLPVRTRRLFTRLERHPEVCSLRNIAQVDIGVVTGANDFFLLTRDQVQDLGVPSGATCSAISRARDVPGANVEAADLERFSSTGRSTELLLLDPETDRDANEPLGAYIAGGERQGLHTRTQCRRREPWWSVKVPRLGVPDAFLTYMSDTFPRLVRNKAGVLATNTIHHVAFQDPSSGDALVAGFYNSLTLLSAELYGRSYGGGTLKLEPREAESLLVPRIPRELGRRLSLVDQLVRAGDLEGVVSCVDPLVLPRLGLGNDEIRALRTARERLVARRRKLTT